MPHIYKVKCSGLLLLCFALLPHIAPAAEVTKVIGQVTSFRASSDGVQIPGGGTLLVGDVIKTEQGGTATVLLSGNARAVLSEDTSVQFQKLGDRVIARVSAGQVVVEGTGTAAPFIETPKYLVRANGDGKSVCLVAVLSETNLVVTAHTGKLSISDMRGSGQPVSLAEGQYATIDESKGAASKEWKLAPLPSGSTPMNPRIVEISNWKAHEGSKGRDDGVRCGRDDYGRKCREAKCDNDHDRDDRGCKKSHKVIAHHEKKDCDDDDWACRYDAN